MQTARKNKNLLLFCGISLLSANFSANAFEPSSEGSMPSVWPATCKAFLTGDQKKSVKLGTGEWIGPCKNGKGEGLGYVPDHVLSEFVYRGEMRNGLPHGKGILTHKLSNPMVRTGEWRNGHFVSGTLTGLVCAKEYCEFNGKFDGWAPSYGELTIGNKVIHNGAAHRRKDGSMYYDQKPAPQPSVEQNSEEGDGLEAYLGAATGLALGGSSVAAAAVMVAATAVAAVRTLPARALLILVH